jgi:hypothetical protein
VAVQQPARHPPAARPPSGGPPTSHAAPEGAAARYLTLLRPVLVSATTARSNWVRFLNDVASRADLAGATPEAVQVALGQASQFGDVRRQLSAMTVPDSYQDMHGSIEGWLKSLELSCQIVVRQTGVLTPETLARVREALQEAANDADRFNAQRAAIAAVVKETAQPTGPKPRIIANKKEMRVLAIAGAAMLLLLGIGAWVSTTLLASPEATVTIVGGSPAAATATALAFLEMGGQRRTWPIADVQNRLNQEIAGRRVAYREATVLFKPNDSIVVSGKIQGTADLLTVDVELQIVAENGKPKINVKDLRAVGVSVPVEAREALEKRAEEGTAELAAQLKPTERLERVVVEQNQVTAEIIDTALAKPQGAPPKP